MTVGTRIKATRYGILQPCGFNIKNSFKHRIVTERRKVGIVGYMIEIGVTAFDDALQVLNGPITIARQGAIPGR